MAVEYVSDWENLYGTKIPDEAPEVGVIGESETKVVSAPKKAAPKASKTAEVK